MTGTVSVLRHGETAWSRDRKHTGRTDVDLTALGRRQAFAAAAFFTGRGPYALVVTSPLSRARQTAVAAGLQAEVDERLAEWDYGDYEGRTTAAIRAERPGWDLWRDGCPGGESLVDVVARVESLLDERIRPAQECGDVVVVAHSHLLRVLTARALDLAGDTGRHFVLDPARLGVIGTEHDGPALVGWNLEP